MLSGIRYGVDLEICGMKKIARHVDIVDGTKEELGKSAWAKANINENISEDEKVRYCKSNVILVKMFN